MSIKRMSLKEPKLTKKQKLKREIEQLKDALDYVNDALHREVLRGNNLCKIIYKLVDVDKDIILEMHEIECIAEIMWNNQQ